MANLKVAFITTLSIISSSVYAELSVGVAGGKAEISSGGTKNDGNIYSLSLTATQADGDTESGSMYQLQLTGNSFKTQETTQTGSNAYLNEMSELIFTGGIGGRYQALAGMFLMDVRLPRYKDSMGRKDTDGSMVALGLGVKLRLGPAGSIPGRFSLQGNFMRGGADLLDYRADNQNPEPESYWVNDIKTRLIFNYQGFGVYAETRKMEYKPDNNMSPFARKRDYKSNMLGLTYAF